MAVDVSVSEILKAISGTWGWGPSSISSCSVERLVEPKDARSGDVAVVFSGDVFKDPSALGAATLFVVQEDLWQAFREKVVVGWGEESQSRQGVVLAPQAYLALAQISALFAQKQGSEDWAYLPFEDRDVSPQSGTSASYDKITAIDPSARVSPRATVGPGCRIGAGSVIFPGVVLGAGVEIGKDSHLFPGVVVYPRVRIGDRVRIHSHAVIGADGFGYAPGPRGSTKIWHMGSVRIGNDVEIGAGTCIDRGTLRDTVVESGAKIDNQVQIGHNGHIGAHAVLCAQAGLAGNVRVGVGAILAGKAGIADKLTIGNKSIVGPNTGVSRDVPDGEVVMGSWTARPRKEWWKFLALMERVPRLFDRVKALEEVSGLKEVGKSSSSL